MVKLKYKDKRKEKEMNKPLIEQLEIATPNGDKVISMNKEIYTFLKNCVYDASEYQKEHNWDSTSEEVLKLWDELNKQ